MRRDRASKQYESEDTAEYKADIAKLQNSELMYSAPKIKKSNSSRRNRRRRINCQTRGDARKRKGHKMVMRGMQLIINGEVINADSPLRFVELNYCVITAKDHEK